MSELQNYVAIPMWMLVLLLFLASGAVQYALIGAVRFVTRVAQQRELSREPKGSPSIILLDDHRAESAK